MTDTEKITNRIYDRYLRDGKLPQMPYRPYIRLAVRRPWPGIFASWRPYWRVLLPVLAFWMLVGAALYELTHW